MGMHVLMSSCVGIDFVQERFMGQGAQDNESAVEQAKDEQISDFSKLRKSLVPSERPMLTELQFAASTNLPLDLTCQSRIRRRDLVKVSH